MADENYSGDHRTYQQICEEDLPKAPTLSDIDVVLALASLDSITKEQTITLVHRLATELGKARKERDAAKDRYNDVRKAIDECLPRPPNSDYTAMVRYAGNRLAVLERELVNARDEPRFKLKSILTLLAQIDYDPDLEEGDNTPEAVLSRLQAIERGA